MMTLSFSKLMQGLSQLEERYNLPHDHQLNEAAQKLTPDTPLGLLRQDSRQIQPGDIFCAIRGFDVDAHRFLPQVAKQGAALAFVECIDESLPHLPQIQVQNTRATLALIATLLEGMPSQKLHVTGITGSNGKTSTSLMLQSIHRAAGIEPGLIGTVQYQSQKRQIASKLTTPDALMLQELFAEMVETKTTHVIMESSSIGQDQCRDLGTDYDVLCCINLHREHIDYHGSYEAYRDAKLKFIREAKEDAIVVLNADFKDCLNVIQETKAQVLTYALENEDADLLATDLQVEGPMPSFTVRLNERTCQRYGLPQDAFSQPITLSVSGIHSVANALAALAMGLASSFSPDAIVKGLESYHGVERRFQLVYRGHLPDGDFIVFDDHFANAGNIEVTLKSLEAMDLKRLHLVYALRGKRGVTVMQESMDAFIAEKDLLPELKLYATTSEDVVDQYNEVTPEERACFERMMKEANLSYTFDPHLRGILQKVIASVSPGDTILLAGCQGMDAGCRILFEELMKVHPDWDRAALFEPIQDRVCGR